MDNKGLKKVFVSTLYIISSKSLMLHLTQKKGIERQLLARKSHIIKN